MICKRKDVNLNFSSGLKTCSCSVPVDISGMNEDYSKGQNADDIEYNGLNH